MQTLVRVSEWVFWGRCVDGVRVGVGVEVGVWWVVLGEVDALGG